MFCGWKAEPGIQEMESKSRDVLCRKSEVGGLQIIKHANLKKTNLKRVYTWMHLVSVRDWWCYCPPLLPPLLCPLTPARLIGHRSSNQLAFKQCNFYCCWELQLVSMYAEDCLVCWTVLPVLPGTLILKNWVSGLLTRSWFLHSDILHPAQSNNCPASISDLPSSCVSPKWESHFLFSAVERFYSQILLVVWLEFIHRYY